MNHSNRKYTSYSDLSAANLSRALSSPPVAESTHLEGFGRSGSTSRSGLFGSPTKVVVGGTTSGKRKPTSPLHNSRTSFKSAGNLSSVGFGRIDSQVYTDAQSRGLVNRLVKYHDRTQPPLNRSQSVTSVYSKPGQFPVVHLKKTEIKYSPRRNNSITSVRIAPPEKSVFQANTRSNILRSGSLLIPAEPHLKQSSRGPAPEDEIDAENRVIAPTAELEAAPTRSVLDALKEISRKRINNEELDADRIKKQCKELSEVDSGGGGGGGGTKRARELTSSSSPPSRGSGEQKKRLCSKNNDILSSLSSSLVMSTPRRVSQVQAKPGRLNVDQTFSTPMAVVPVGQNASAAAVMEGRAESSREPAKVNRVESAPLPQIVRSVPEVVPAMRPKPTQPKLTLFNKKYDETVVRPVVSDSEEQEDEEELGGRISFIKPKDKSPILNCSKVTMKQVERSKLSMILSCLSEDFDDEEEDPAPKKVPIVVAKDTVDSVSAKVEEKKVEAVVPKPSGIAALISEPIKDPGLGKIVPPKAVESVKASEPPKAAGGFSFETPSKSDLNATFSFQTPTKPTAPAESKPVEKPASGFTFGSAPAAVPKVDAPPAYSFPTTTTASSAPAPATSGFASIPSVPSSIIATPATTTLATPNLISFSPAPPAYKPEAPKTSFSLLPAISTNASSGSPQNALITSQATIPAFGSGSGFSAFKPLSPTGSSTAVTTSAVNIPAFGATTTTSGGSFAFGAPSLKPATTAATVATTSAPSSTTSAFSFGGAATSGAPALTGSASTPAFGVAPTAAPKFGFGSSTTTATSVPSFGSTTATTSAPTSFGGGFAPPTTAPPAFGSIPSASTVTSVTSPPLPSGLFGAAAVSKPAFGQSTQPASSSFSFGGAAAQPSSTITTTGGTSSGAFSFGAVAPTTTAAAPPPTTTSHIFGGGGSSSTASTFGGAPAFGSQQVPAFGTVSSGNPPAFGASNGGTSSAPAPASGFGATSVFGAGSSLAAAPANTSSVFGASSTVTSPFGGVSSTSAPTGNIFGAPTSTQSNATLGSSPFSFGAPPAASAPTNAAAPSLAPTASKPFSFGGVASTNSNVTSTTGSFGFSAGSNTPAPAPAASAFSFSNNNNNNNNSSSTGSHSVAPPPAFGSPGNNTTFSFNANRTSSSNTATVKPFSFGTPSQPTVATSPAAGGGIFGAAATSPPPAFNFSAGAHVAAAPSGGPAAFSFAGANPAAPGAGGPFGMANGGSGAPIFSIGTGGGANVPPGRRPIRTATRRLK